MKNTFVLAILVLAMRVVFAQSSTSSSISDNSSSWISLMDSAQWKGYNMDKLPPHWHFKGDVIECSGAGGGMDGDIITKDVYADFELYIEWKISDAGNSGIFYHVIEDKATATAYMTGPEYQLLDDAGFPGKENLKPAQLTASDYDMTAAPTNKILKPSGEWNQTHIVVQNRRVTYYLNGQVTVSFNIWSPEWYALKAKSKWADMPHWGMAGTGHIGLQDHGSGVWFRNVKILPL
jgi:hypothetical protein